jgi:hypothetical protein
VLGCLLLLLMCPCAVCCVESRAEEDRCPLSIRLSLSDAGTPYHPGIGVSSVRGGVLAMAASTWARGLSGRHNQD